MEGLRDEFLKHMCILLYLIACGYLLLFAQGLIEKDLNAKPTSFLLLY